MKNYKFLIVCFSILFFNSCNYNPGLGPGFPEYLIYQATYKNGKNFIEDRYTGLYLYHNRLEMKPFGGRIFLGKSFLDPSPIVLLEYVSKETKKSSRNNFSFIMQDKDEKYFKALVKFKRTYAELQFYGPFEDINDEIGENFILFIADN